MILLNSAICSVLYVSSPNSCCSMFSSVYKVRTLMWVFLSGRVDLSRIWPVCVFCWDKIHPISSSRWVFWSCFTCCRDWRISTKICLCWEWKISSRQRHFWTDRPTITYGHIFHPISQVTHSTLYSYLSQQNSHLNLWLPPQNNLPQAPKYLQSQSSDYWTQSNSHRNAHRLR